MKHALSGRLVFSLIVAGLLISSSSRLGAEVIFFANGRTMSVKEARLTGDTITVTLRNGGEATFDRGLVAYVGPDEAPWPVPSPAARRPVGVPQTPLASRPFAQLIETVALRHGVDPALVHAVVEAESNYRPEARSHVGARGLMQVMPSTARDLGVTNARMLFDPHQNLDAGVRYLKMMLQRFDGDLPTAIAAYNAGPGAVSKYEGIPPYPETRNYVRKVLSNFQQ